MQVEVMYDGWPEEYDEIVRVDSDRVAPFHTFTWAVKCWVKYLNWPLWPSVVRCPARIIPPSRMVSPNVVVGDVCWVDYDSDTRNGGRNQEPREGESTIRGFPG